MAYKKKTWVDRVSATPNRRTLTIESQTDTTIVATVQRSEGTISKEGDAFNAENMNDLETRIENALGEKLDGEKLETDISIIKTKTGADGSAPDCYAIKQLYDELKKLVVDGKKLIADAINAQGITTTSSSATFEQLAAAITTTGNSRYSNGYNAGYSKGKSDGTSAGQTTGYNTGYAAGKADGITYADGRVNTSSESYKSGYSSGQSAGYESGYNAGVSAADARVNTSSASYQSGYNAGVAAADARVNTSSASYKSGYSAGSSAGIAGLNKSVSTSCSYRDSRDAGSRIQLSGSGSATATIKEGRLYVSMSASCWGQADHWSGDEFVEACSTSAGSSGDNSVAVA